MAGYVSLHRDIQKHWLYEEERVFSRYEAWLDIMMRVNHAEGKVTHNGTVETVPRGSTIWSMGDMEKHWGWSNKKVKRFLLCLERDRMLSVKSTTKKTYLTVVNYDKYQGSDMDKAPPMHQQSTTDAFQKHTNNNELIMTNNNKEDLKNTTTTTNAFNVFEREKFGFITTSIADKIKAMIEMYTEIWVIKAIEEASYYGKRYLPYVKTTLEDWKLKNHPEPWTLEQQKEDKPQSNVTRGNFNKTYRPKPQIIAEPPKSAPLTPEELEDMRKLAQKLDGNKSGRSGLLDAL